MKRILALVLVLALCLAGCGKKEEEAPAPAPEKPAPTVPVKEDLTIAELAVEFVADGRNTEDMLKLKAEFPDVMKKALAEFDVDVERVTVTFGASAAATAEALAAGSVQVGFLPGRSYYEAGESLIAIATGIQTEGETEVYSLVMPVELGELDGEETAENAPEDIIPGFDPLEALAVISAEELVCAIPAEDEMALRALEFMLFQLRPDIDFTKVENIREYTTFTSNLFDTDLVVRKGMEALSDSRHPALTGIALGGSMIAVSAADEVAAGEAFRAALSRAIDEIQLSEVWSAVFDYYGGAYYIPTSPEEERLSRWLYGYSDKKPAFE